MIERSPEILKSLAPLEEMSHVSLNLNCEFHTICKVMLDSTMLEAIRSVNVRAD